MSQTMHGAPMADSVTQLFPNDSALPALKKCPSCRTANQDLLCRGHDPVPAWQVVCANCRAAGPAGYGFARGDDGRARLAAAVKWNELPRSATDK